MEGLCVPGLPTLVATEACLGPVTGHHYITAVLKRSRRVHGFSEASSLGARRDGLAMTESCINGEW
jgi:hypothetical protein